MESALIALSAAKLDPEQYAILAAPPSHRQEAAIENPRHRGDEQALLVALFFMHLREARPTYRLVAIAGLFTLALLVSLSLADYSTRAHFAAPWQAPSSR